MTLTKREQKILEQLGGASQIDRELRHFRRAAAVLSSRRVHLMEKYPKQWVAVYRGRIRSAGQTLDEVIAEVHRKALPRKDVIVRFIDKNERTFILYLQ